VVRAAFFELRFVDFGYLDQILHHVVLGSFWFGCYHVSEGKSNNYSQKDARIESHDKEHDEST